jgi:ABC-2 type transport system ATP-binding protein
MAIVAALMIQAPLIILDEPTTGLDPLMRDEFLQLVNEERQRGASVIMSSNTIEELERVCDRVMMISKGRLIDIADVHAIESRTLRDYKIEFETAEDYQAFIQGRKDVLRVQSKYHQVTLRLEQSEINALFQNLEHYQVKYLTQVPYTLKTYFDERSL